MCSPMVMALIMMSGADVRLVITTSSSILSIVYIFGVCFHRVVVAEIS
jgi:hypothetical protein